MAKNVGDSIVKILLFGVGGWVAENALCQQDRYSPLFRGAKFPFLPIYAVNGLALTSAAPYLSKWPALARGLSYAILGTSIEWAGCQLDRKMMNQRGWDYGRNEPLSRLSDGCVSFPRSALWGGMGLIAEKMT